MSRWLVIDEVSIVSCVEAARSTEKIRRALTRCGRPRKLRRAIESEFPKSPVLRGVRVSLDR